MVVLDTSILIDHIRRPAGSNSTLTELIDEYPDEYFVIPIVAIQELYGGLSSKTSQKQRLLIAIISGLKILSYDYEVARLAGEIARDLNRKIGFPDAAIAATVILNKAKLFTLNKKDFQGIKGLKLI